MIAEVPMPEKAGMELLVVEMLPRTIPRTTWAPMRQYLPTDLVRPLWAALMDVGEQKAQEQLIPELR
jgi:hypothetical protein